MTVKELIDELKKYDEKTEVIMLVSEGSDDDVHTGDLDELRIMHGKILIGELK